MWGFSLPLNIVLGFNLIIDEEVDFTRKPNIIQTFLIIFEFLWKPLTHAYPIFRTCLGQCLLDLNSVGRKSESLVQMCQKEDTEIPRFCLLRCKDLDGFWPTIYWILVIFLGVRIVIWSPDDEEDVALRYSQAQWALRFLTN